MSPILEGYWNLLTGRNKELMKVRCEICSGCVFLSVSGSCLRCGCGVRAKASVTQEKCPEGKW